MGQDVIIKKDSSRITAKVYTINEKEIIYSEFYDQKHKTQRVQKTEAIKIVFRNGTEIVFNPSLNNKIDTTLIMVIKKKRKKLDTLKTGDYVKFNLQVGAVINNSYSNIIRRQETASHGFINEFSATNDRKYNSNINIGLNFLLGSSPYIKHLIGVNYLRSKGEFNYDLEDNPFASTSVSQHLQYVSKIDFINLTTGLRFKINKRIHIEPLISFNFFAHGDLKYSGSETTRNGNRYTTEYYNNKSVVGRESMYITHTISLNPRICYDLDFIKEKLELYVSYNFALKYRLPWCMIGVTFYPFKKLQ